MTVVYADSVFLINGTMDYILLLVTARLAGIPLRRRRYLLAALLGAVYAVAVFLPNLAFLNCLPVKLAAGSLVALLAYGGEAKLLRLTALLFAVACAMAGCVLALGLISGSRIPITGGIFYTDVSARTLFASAATAYFFLTLVFRTAASHGVKGELLKIRVCIGGKVIQLTALRDTGNALRDPVCGKSVLVAAPGVLDQILPTQVRQLLSAHQLRSPAELAEPLRKLAPSLRPRLLPYRTVGLSGGLLLTLRTDWIEVDGQQHMGLPVALSPTSLGSGYAALWGSEKGGGFHDRSVWQSAAAFNAPGTGGGECPLHRRQRYAASAADPAAGSGTSGKK